MIRCISFACIVLTLLFYNATSIYGQEGTPIVNRSETIQLVDGKEYFFHPVLQGQTLFSIARAYGVTVQDIERENPEVRDHGLRFNQMIRIPVARDTGSARDVQQEYQQEVVYVQHQVRRRETLYGISRMYDLPIEELLEHNPEARSGLRVNMMLKIPRHQQRLLSYQMYEVPPGQTLFSLSREFSISVEDIKALNPELEQGLRAGQVIRIPVEHTQVVQPPFIVPTPQQLEILETQPEIRERDPYCDNPKLKSSYDVALLIPLYLEAFIREEDRRLPAGHPSFTFMEYYAGIRIALDSIRAKGHDIRLHVYDVCDSLPKTRAVLRKPELSKMDLIIGPFHPSSLELAGEFARPRNIPVVSPLYREDNRLVRRFTNMYQATPSIQVQMNEMARFIAENHPHDNLILVHNNQSSVLPLITEYKQFLNREINRKKYVQDSTHLAQIDGYYLNGGVYVGERVTNVFVLNDSLLQSRQPDYERHAADYEQFMQRENLHEVVFGHDGMTRLMGKMDPTRRNVLISLMGGQALITNYVRQLNQQRDSFPMIVYGVPQWAGYESVDLRHMQNLNVHLFTPWFVDYEQSHNIDFIAKFRKLYHSEPREYAYRAVQTGLFFFNALAQYGSEFYKCTSFINQHRPPNSPFYFHRIDNGSNHGWENHFVYIYRYHNMQLRVVNTYEQKNIATKP